VYGFPLASAHQLLLYITLARPPYRATRLQEDHHHCSLSHDLHRCTLRKSPAAIHVSKSRNRWQSGLASGPTEHLPFTRAPRYLQCLAEAGSSFSDCCRKHGTFLPTTPDTAKDSRVPGFTRLHLLARATNPGVWHVVGGDHDF
jgi:hypothetical protein